MPITQVEFEIILADTTKQISQDLKWAPDEDHSPALVFRCEIDSEPGYPLFVCGRYNALAQTTSFSLIHRGTGRIYGLDLGAEHHNPTCEHVGEKHKHRWTDQYADKLAYEPDDITEPATEPVKVWLQFCAEADIIHSGKLSEPPPVQLEIGL